MVNVFFRYRNLFTNGLEFGAGVYDIMNSKHSFYQPYFGSKPPVPGPSGGVYMKLSYSLNFKNKKKKERMN